ncbi:hypothetical protein CPB84DRAFT_1776327 [Gymnopilus junonius]|uniref:F-box domain-containing protein n=1 Tax=Gymnopilus junonius TaxID=109634 RepID=A0A9P5NR51_GYMJU|nr:hypothetical protein CPB84DRAFT_1776327 [Gymnopilus junonius]
MWMDLQLSDLGNDILPLIFCFLKTPDLRCITLLSQKCPQQVLDFCNFSLKYNLCARITAHPAPPVNFFKGYIRGNDVAQTELFAIPLTEVLTGATNLAHLAFQDCTDLIVGREPFIANIICQRPPAISLELSKADLPIMKMFTTVSGLRKFTINLVPPPKYDNEEEEALEAILLNSNSTLETLSLGHTLPASLRSESESPPLRSWDRVHTFSMPNFSVLPEKLAHMFPSISTLNIEDSSIWVTRIRNGKKSSGGHSRSPNAHQGPYGLPFVHFSGPRPLALNLSRHHALRRISFMGTKSYTYPSEFAELTEMSLNADIHSLALKTELLGDPDAAFQSRSLVEGQGYPPNLDPLFSTLCQSAKHLTFLSLDVGQTMQEIPRCLEHLYVHLGVVLCMGPSTWTPFPMEVTVRPEELLRAWVDGVPSLQYLELQVPVEGWGHNWTFKQVSEERYKCEDWFDLEEWK